MPTNNYTTSAPPSPILTAEEQHDPTIVLRNLFDFAHLPSLRAMLWNWLSVTVKSSFNKKDCDYRQRDNIVLLYEKLQCLLEASWLLTRQNTAAPASTAPPISRKDDSELQLKIEEFFQAHPPARLHSTIRQVLLEYIGHSFEIAVPSHLQTMMWDFSDLFDLLDFAAKHFPSNEK